jgi:hypothetical protein
MRATEASQSQAIELEDAFEVGEQHLDLLALVSRLLVLLCLGDRTGYIAGLFMNAAGDLSMRSVRATAILERATGTVQLTGPIDDGVSLGDVVARILELPPADSCTRCAPRAT